MGASALAVPTLTDAFGRAISSRPNADRKLGVALVGLGIYSKNQLAPALQLTEHCRLAGIVTGNARQSRRVDEEVRYSKGQRL